MVDDKFRIEVDATLLSELFSAALSADYTTLRRLGNQVAKKLTVAGDEPGARSIRALMRQRGVPLQASGYVESIPRDAGSRLPLIEEMDWPSSASLVNAETTRSVERFLEDARNIDLLAREGVSTRLGLLLYGPPGTGKSVLAGQIAADLKRPIYVARLDSLISSRLGETSKNIRGIFDFIPTKEAILFLDEMDAIAKLRDDRHELGELKRVVNTVLQGLDSLNDNVIVIGATNHAHLLDAAIWRRFPYKVELAAPDQHVRVRMWDKFLRDDRKTAEQDISILTKLSEGMTGAEIEQVALAARRRQVLDGIQVSLGSIVLAIDGLRSGGTPTMDGVDLTADEKRKIVHLLRPLEGVSIADIGRALGVSRQMAHKYVKEQSDG
tara:strand:- start:34248 stop:35393 length:1146 start_codon:yes stop_codon:yes gene_type:complete